MAGFLDDIGKGIMDAAAGAVTGMSNEERDDLLRNMMSGKMDFNDYLKMSMMMQNQGGAAGIFNTVTNIPGLQQSLGLEQGTVEEAEQKLTKYSKIIAAMSEEERAQPNYFLVGEGADERIGKLARDAEMEEGFVRTFFTEFKEMKGFLVKLGVGMSSGKSKEQVIRELEREAKEKEGEDAGKPKRSSGKGEPFVNPERRKKKLAKLRKRGRPSGSAASSRASRATTGRSRSSIRR